MRTYIIPVSDTQAYRQFGNSVVVPMIADVANLIIAELNRCEALSEKKEKLPDVYMSVQEKEKVI